MDKEEMKTSWEKVKSGFKWLKENKKKVILGVMAIGILFVFLEAFF